jgi:hypothetical protein
MKNKLFNILLLLSLFALSGCYQIGYVAGTGVNAVRHPIDTAGKVYRY